MYKLDHMASNDNYKRSKIIVKLIDADETYTRPKGDMDYIVGDVDTHGRWRDAKGLEIDLYHMGIRNILSALTYI